MTRKKLILEEAKKEFIDKNLIPLFDEYKNNKEKLLAKTKEGYLFIISIHGLRYICMPNVFYKFNPYTIQNIKLWCKLNNKSFELISEEYEDSNKKLKWKCLKEGCGEIFYQSWDIIHRNYGCPYCAGKSVGLSNCLGNINLKLINEWNYEKNNSLTPYNVTCNSGKKVWWICEKGHEWEAVIASRNNGKNCPYCDGQKATEENNLLAMNPELCKEWDYKKNNKNPKEYCPNSHNKIWWKCLECGGEWITSIANRNHQGTGCPQCNRSKGEKRINKWLNEHNVFYIPQKEFSNLLGLGNKYLSYDFYFPNYNLLIEYQGEQHKKYIPGFHKSKKDFEKQQEHDKRKRDYARDNNIRLLEIWYWDFDNIENILDNTLNILVLNEVI